MGQPTRIDTFASLRIPDFRYFVMNSFLITATLLIQEVTLGYELYKMTHDPLMLGLVGLAEAIPFIAVSLFGGHLADRRDKKRILQWSLLIILLGSVILYLVFQPSFVVRLSRTAQLATIYGVLMLIGTAKGFYSPASSSLKPFLVPRELYPNSATWSSSFWQAGAILGPGVAGFLYSWVGFDNTPDCSDCDAGRLLRAHLDGEPETRAREHVARAKLFRQPERRVSVCV